MFPGISGPVIFTKGLSEESINISNAFPGLLNSSLIPTGTPSFQIKPDPRSGSPHCATFPLQLSSLAGTAPNQLKMSAILPLKALPIVLSARSVIPEPQVLGSQVTGLLDIKVVIPGCLFNISSSLSSNRRSLRIRSYSILFNVASTSKGDTIYATCVGICKSVLYFLLNTWMSCGVCSFAKSIIASSLLIISFIT